MKKFISALLLAMTCMLTPLYARQLDLSDAATAVSRNVAQAKVYPGERGSPIFIFEERHDSYTMNLEESVSLLRLFQRYNLRAIALEGFIKGESNPFANEKPSPAAALALLKNGDINSAVFMSIGYGVSVNPIELASEYVESSENMAKLTIDYLLKISFASFNTKIIEGKISPEISAKYLDLKKANDVSKMRDLIFESDEFVKDQLEKLTQMRQRDATSVQNSSATSYEVAFFEGIQKQAERVHAEVDPGTILKFSGYVNFLKARRAASNTMADEVAALADADDGVIALIIGAAHTADIVPVLIKQGRPVVVVSPLFKPSGGREILFSKEQLKALYRGQPVGSDLLSLSVRALNKVKPKPNFSAPWLQAKSEIYAKVDDLVGILLGDGRGGNGNRGNGGDGIGNGGEGGGDKPRSGLLGNYPDGADFRRALLALPANVWNGRHVRLDRSRLEVVKTDRGTSVIFPAQIINSSGQVEKEFWIRAGKSGEVTDLAIGNVEQSILNRLKVGKGPEEEAKESGNITEIDVIELSKLSKMVISPTKAAALEVDIFVN